MKRKNHILPVWKKGKRSSSFLSLAIPVLLLLLYFSKILSYDNVGHTLLNSSWGLEYQTSRMETGGTTNLKTQPDCFADVNTPTYNNINTALTPKEENPYLIDGETENDTSRYGIELTSLVLAFEENKGQTDDEVDFIARGGGYSVFLADARAVIDINKDGQRQVLQMDLVGANSDLPVYGEDALTSRSNYMIGDKSNWQTDLANFASVRYENVYDGIDLRYYGNQRQLEYDFIVNVGADKNNIRLNFNGVTKAELTEGGELQLILNNKDDFITFKAPVSYQLADNGSRMNVASSYVIHEDGTVGFAIGNYDPCHKLVIDPVLDYVTFVGGTGYDSFEGIDSDNAGNAYFTGWAGSTDFPTTVGAYDTSHGGGSYDIYVAKLNSSGTSLIYSTYVGGSGSDTGNSIAVDASGNVYVVGSSTSSDFITVNAYQNALSGTSDAVLIKLNSAGNTLMYSSYFGGSDSETGYDVALNSSNIVYVVGSTGSTNLPVLNSYDSTLGGTTDGFLAKFDLTQTGVNSLLYSSYFGGSTSDISKSVDVDSNGNIYIAGYTNSTDLTTMNAYQASNGGNYDVFASKFTSDGSTLLYSTYLGGSSSDYAEAIKVDDSGGNMYIGGRTAGGFPASAGAYDLTFGGGSADGFVTKINSTLSGAASLIYSTYLGGSGFDYVIGLDVDASGNTYLAGFTGSSAFPTTIDGNDKIMTGVNDGFFAVLNATGTNLTYSTFIGGTGQDRVKDVTWNAATGSAYVGGQNEFPDGPTSPAPTVFGPMGGGRDAYVAKFEVVPVSSCESKAPVLSKN